WGRPHGLHPTVSTIASSGYSCPTVFLRLLPQSSYRAKTPKQVTLRRLKESRNVHRGCSCLFCSWRADLRLVRIGQVLANRRPIAVCFLLAHVRQLVGIIFRGRIRRLGQLRQQLRQFSLQTRQLGIRLVVHLIARVVVRLLGNFAESFAQILLQELEQFELGQGADLLSLLVAAASSTAAIPTVR